jgi:hypothetical protein
MPNDFTRQGESLGFNGSTKLTGKLMCLVSQLINTPYFITLLCLTPDNFPLKGRVLCFNGLI